MPILAREMGSGFLFGAVEGAFKPPPPPAARADHTVNRRTSLAAPRRSHQEMESDVAL